MLVELARSGDLEARRVLIENHLPLALGMKRPEARSEALLGLVRGVDHFLRSALPVAMISAYLKGVVVRAAVDASRDEMRYEARLRKIRGGVSRWRDESFYRAQDQQARLTAREELEACCWSSLDTWVVELRLEGHTVPEIAVIIGIRPGTVWAMLRNIRTRLLRRTRTEDLCDDLGT